MARLIQGDIDVLLKGIRRPSDDTDAVNKEYVDAGFVEDYVYTVVPNYGSASITLDGANVGVDGRVNVNTQVFDNQRVIEFLEDDDPTANLRGETFIRVTDGSSVGFYKVASVDKFATNFVRLASTPVNGDDVLANVSEGDTGVEFASTHSALHYQPHVFDTNFDGLVPGPNTTEATSQYALRGDGTWVSVTDDETYNFGTGLSVDTDTDPDTVSVDTTTIATRDYVDNTFVEEFGYTNSGVTQVRTVSPSNTQVSIGDASNGIRYVEFGNTSFDTRQHTWYRITVGSQTRYYLKDHTYIPPGQGTKTYETIYLKDQPITGSDIIGNLSDGTAITIGYTDEGIHDQTHTFTTDYNGLVPAPDSSEDDTSHYLRGDGTWGTISAGIFIQDEGSNLPTQATSLNFTGSGVTASGTGSSKTISIPGGLGDYAIINVGSSPENATADSNGAIAIGDNANAGQANSIAIGLNSVCPADSSENNTIAIGTAASARDTYDIAIGNTALAVNRFSIAIGAFAEAGDEDNTNGTGTAVGTSSQATGTASTAYGRAATASGLRSVAVGEDSQSTGVRSISLGHYARLSGQDAIAIGSNSTANNNESIALGYNAATTAANQLVIGSTTASDSITSIVTPGFTGGTGQFISIDANGNWGTAVPAGGGGGGDFTLSDATDVLDYSADSLSEGDVLVWAAGDDDEWVAQTPPWDRSIETILDAVTAEISDDGSATTWTAVSDGADPGAENEFLVTEDSNDPPASYTIRFRTEDIDVSTISTATFLETYHTANNVLQDGAWRITQASYAGTNDEFYDVFLAPTLITGSTLSLTNLISDDIDSDVANVSFASDSKEYTVDVPSNSDIDDRADARIETYIDVDKESDYTAPNASGDSAVAAGTNSTASGVDSIALGKNAEASGTNTTALGINSEASFTNATAIGASATADHSYSTAVGYQSNVDTTHEIRLGKDGDRVTVPTSVAGNEAHNNQLTTKQYVDAQVKSETQIISVQNANTLRSVEDNGTADSLASTYTMTDSDGTIVTVRDTGLGLTQYLGAFTRNPGTGDGETNAIFSGTLSSSWRELNDTYTDNDAGGPLTSQAENINDGTDLVTLTWQWTVGSGDSGQIRLASDYTLQPRVGWAREAGRPNLSNQDIPSFTIKAQVIKLDGTSSTVYGSDADGIRVISESNTVNVHFSSHHTVAAYDADDGGSSIAFPLLDGGSGTDHHESLVIPSTEDLISMAEDDIIAVRYVVHFAESFSFATDQWAFWIVDPLNGRSADTMRPRIATDYHLHDYRFILDTDGNLDIEDNTGENPVVTQMYNFANGTFNPGVLGTGSAGEGQVLHGDGTWKDLDSDTQDYIAINSTGTHAAATGTDGIAIGRNSDATATDSIVIGSDSTSSGDSSVAIGDGLTVSGAGSFVYGDNRTVSGDRSIVIGGGSNLTSHDSVSIGTSAEATAQDAIAIGQTATASGTESTSIGLNSTASGESSIAIGEETDATDTRAIAIGENAQATGGSSVAIGGGNSVLLAATASSTASVAIGHDSIASASNSSAFGRSASAAHSNSTAIGYQALTTSSDEIMLGRDNDSTSVGIAGQSNVLFRVTGNYIDFNGAITPANNMRFDTSSTSDATEDPFNNFRQFSRMLSPTGDIGTSIPRISYYTEAQASSISTAAEGEISRIIKEYDYTLSTTGWVMQVFHYNDDGDLESIDLTYIQANRATDGDAVFLNSDTTVWATGDGSNATPVSSGSDGFNGRFVAGQWTGYNKAASEIDQAVFLGRAVFEYDTDGNITGTYKYNRDNSGV